MKDHTNLNTNMLNTCLKLQSDSLIRYFSKGKFICVNGLRGYSSSFDDVIWHNVNGASFN